MYYVDRSSILAYNESIDQTLHKTQKDTAMAAQNAQTQTSANILDERFEQAMRSINEQADKALAEIRRDIPAYVRENLENWLREQR